MLFAPTRTLPGLCRPHPLAAAAAALCLAGAAHAQQAPQAEPAQTVALAPAQGLPAVTVTATLSEQDARTAPASVTVINPWEA